MRLKVAIVAPIAVRYDAISIAVRDTYGILASDDRFQPVHLGAACDFPEMVHVPCGDVAELLLAPAYQQADVAIFHFGVHHSLFDALLMAGPPTRVVRFHNVTPPQFVASGDRPLVERSARQIDVLRNADEIWADSETNAYALLQRGFDAQRIKVIPLVVEDPAPAFLAAKPAAPVGLLYFGRIAPAKGVHDLIDALACSALPRGSMKLIIAGNTAWSDPRYLDLLRSKIARSGLEEVVDFVGTVADDTRERLFHSAHLVVIPSYHEGFCRPVAEGFRAGCVPVVYDASNLPLMVDGLGRVVACGDVPALSAALTELVQTMPAAIRYSDRPGLPLDCGSASVREFDARAKIRARDFAFERVARLTRERLSDLVRHEDLRAVGAHRLG